MKFVQNTARNIFIMDDETAFGSIEALDEQPQTAPIEQAAEKNRYCNMAHPLRGLLTSALSLIASRPELLPELFEEPSLNDDDADELTRHDDLISLYDDETEVETDTLSTAVSVLDSIVDSIAGQNDGVKTPLFLSAFKSRFLR